MSQSSCGSPSTKLPQALRPTCAYLMAKTSYMACSLSFRFARHRVAPFAPAGDCAVRRGVDHGLDGPDAAALDLEDFGDLPGPRNGWAVLDLAAVGECAEARIAAGVVEERERERESTLGVEQHEPAIANPRDVVEHAALELLAAPDHVSVRPAVSARAHACGVAGRDLAVLEPCAVVGDGVGALAIVALDAGEVGVRDAHELDARQAVGERDRIRPRVARRPDLVDALGRLAVADHERFDLADLSIRDAQTRDQDRRRIGFADRAHEHGLATFDVGELQRVAARARDGVPQALTERESLAVFGEPRVACNG